MTDIRAALREKFGGIELVELAGGYNNPVFAAEIGDRQCVIKASVGDMNTEARALEILGGALSPVLYDTLRIGEYTALVMSRVSGKNIQSLFDSGETRLVLSLCELLGERLARDVHSVRNVGGIPRARIENVLPLPKFVPRVIAYEYERVIRGIDFEGACLTHGDFGIHNALYTDGRNIALLDWEWAELAAPERDISWFLWFFRLHYPEKADEYIAKFIAGYAKNGEKIITKLRPWAMYQVAKILRVAENTDDETRAEWLRRAEWTAAEFDISC